MLRIRANHCGGGGGGGGGVALYKGEDEAGWLCSAQLGRHVERVVAGALVQHARGVAGGDHVPGIGQHTLPKPTERER